MKYQHSKQHPHLEAPVGPEVRGSPCELMASCSREGIGTAGSLYEDDRGNVKFEDRIEVKDSW